MIPQVERECVRLKQQLDAVGWQGCVQLKIMRNSFGSFGKKLGAFKLPESPHSRLMPWYLATDGRLYTYMRSDVADGYGAVRLRQEAASSLEKALRILRSNSIT